jgi:hypothetical protein
MVHLLMSNERRWRGVHVLGAKDKKYNWLLHVEVGAQEMTLLTSEEKELLTRAANLMEELLETLEIVQDKKLVKDLKAAMKEVEEGKTRPLDELIRELDLEDETRS